MISFLMRITRGRIFLPKPCEPGALPCHAGRDPASSVFPLFIFNKYRF